jgi:hypothetical protein
LIFKVPGLRWISGNQKALTVIIEHETFMRHRALLLIYFLGASGLQAFTQCCAYTINMTDSYGDGWNGGRQAAGLRAVGMHTEGKCPVFLFIYK